MYLFLLGLLIGFIEGQVMLTSGTYWTVLYGTYANVIITTFAAVVGANSLSPITGVGHNATPWQESLVTVGFGTIGIAMLVSSVGGCAEPQ
jgi:hydroxylaminobenzene mutase